MALWSSFHPLILPDVPGCPQVTVDTALAASAAEFCAGTHIWRETLDSFDTEIGEALYDLYASAVVESVPMLVVNSVLAENSDMRLLDPTSMADTGCPTHFLVQDDRSLRLFPIPDAVYPVVATVTLKPSRSAKSIPDWIYETFAEGIVSGALWRLMRIPGKGWSSLELATSHKAIFDKAIVDARNRDYRHVPLRVRPQSF